MAGSFLCDVMKDALIHDKNQFVQVIIENGFNLEDFIKSEGTLEGLYKEVGYFIPEALWFRRPVFCPSH